MEYISVQINGKSEKIEKGISVRRYLETTGISPNVVACELNLKILKRSSLGDTFLSEGDVLEVIHMIGGG